MTIICIGDSHGSFFSGLGTKEKPFMQAVYGQGSQKNALKQFKGTRIGAATAYQLHNKIPILESIINKEYKNGDTILFCFGEVDCRLHLPKRIILNAESEDSVVNECVERYYSVIKKFHTNGIKCAVWGVIGSNPPSLPYPTQYRVGTMQQRNKITILFNKLIKTRCQIDNIPFVSIFDIMVNDDLITNPTFIMDHIHLSQSVMPQTLKLFKEGGLIQD